MDKNNTMSVEEIHNKVVNAWVAEEIRTLNFGYKSVHLKLDREVQISIDGGGMVFNFTPRNEDRLRVFLGMYLK